ncbi:head maturation protease, ClpP-related [uncultured Gilvimarinus sp.]|uniref:head maturation protease, ClpP-related n=1 Tax=uncultured Gilvimarinus sp. TaxID=1689143 RepID=UPI0030D92301
MNIAALMKQKASLPSGLKMDIAPRALELWDTGVKAAADDAEGTISILDVIGADMWGEGVTARRIAGALRNIGAANPVTVYINSPGGDVFEGLAIHSLLKEHSGKVTVKVLGLAASAASVIAMAADEIQIARAGFFMIHNAWTCACGNRHDMREVADFLEPFDRAMADLYQDRTGIDNAIELMDAETWLGGADALEQGFADAIMHSDELSADASAGGHANAVRKLDIALAKSGLTRAERRKLINDFKSGTQDAAGNGTPGATESDTQTAVGLSLELGALGSLSSNLLATLN